MPKIDTLDALDDEMMMWIKKMRMINDHLAKHQEEERQRQEREGGGLEKRRQTVS